MTLEICCADLQSVRAAIEGGADRIELCRDLDLDGLTPNREMIREAARLCHPAGVRVHVLIRCRDGNFVYTPDEVQTMTDEIRMALKEGADGIVVGALTPDGDIDLDACRQWLTCINESKQQPETTFHRAFDVCRNPMQTLLQIRDLGFDRILTSGQAPTAEAGIPLLRQLAHHGITILAGAGVSPENAERILTEAGVTELHGSLRTGGVTSTKKVRQIKLL